MILPTSSEKALENILYLLMVQIFNKLDLEGNFFNLRMATFERPVAYTGDSVFPLSLGSRKRCQLLKFLFSIVLVVLADVVKEEKRERDRDRDK